MIDPPVELRNLFCATGAGVLGTRTLSQTSAGESIRTDTTFWSPRTDNIARSVSTTVDRTVCGWGYADGLSARDADTEARAQTVRYRDRCESNTDSGGAIQTRWG